MKFVDTFKKHQQEPNKSLDKYTKETRIQLGEQIKNCKKIYLDTNYWLELRDVILNRQNNAFFVELLELLRYGVESGRLLCPISDIIFCEIFKQSNSLTCETSVNIIDDLSKGVAILSSIERDMLEIMYFLKSHFKGMDSLYPSNVFVWSKVGYILGVTHPTKTPFSSEDELVIQKVFFDHMWKMPLNEIFKTMGMKRILEMPKFMDVTQKLNIGKIQYATENKSFKQLFVSEFAGAMESLEPMFEDALVYLFEKEKGYKPSQEEVKACKSGKQFTNLTYNIFKRNKLKNYLPAVVIGSGLHASVRHDIQRKYKPNDLMDFRHASAALPYFDCFFTERNLKDLISRKNIGFDKKYHCNVLSDPKQAVECVTKIIE